MISSTLDTYRNPLVEFDTGGDTGVASPKTVPEALEQAKRYLAVKSSDLPLIFQFPYEHAQFHGRVSMVNECVVLALTGDVGTLPYTMENPIGRSQILRLVRDSRKLDNIGFQIVDGRIIRVQQLAALHPPVNREQVLAKAIELLFRDRHYFKLINMLRY